MAMQIYNTHSLFTVTQASTANTGLTLRSQNQPKLAKSGGVKPVMSIRQPGKDKVSMKITASQKISSSHTMSICGDK